MKDDEIRAGMLARWAPPEYAVMWEVGEGTGAIRTRYADAVIMSLWPSRGLELHGVEIKVSAIKLVAEFEEASGLKIAAFGGDVSAKEAGALVRLIRAVGVEHTWSGIGAMYAAARRTVEAIEEAAAGSPFTLPTPPSVDFRKRG